MYNFLGGEKRVLIVVQNVISVSYNQTDDGG